MGPFTPNFVTSKRVEAHRIVKIGPGWVVLDRDGAREVFEAPLGFFSRMPKVGDMLVRHVDGTVSHCSAEVFLLEATPLAETPLPNTDLPVPDGPGVPRGRVLLGGDPMRPRDAGRLPPGRHHP